MVRPTITFLVALSVELNRGEGRQTRLARATPRHNRARSHLLLEAQGSQRSLAPLSTYAQRVSPNHILSPFYNSEMPTSMARHPLTHKLLPGLVFPAGELW